MDPAIVSEGLKYGFGVAVLLYVAYQQSKMIAARDARMDAKVDAMQSRCDTERQALSSEIAQVRDAHAKDQREVLLAATNALADVAKTNRELVEIHERREGSGPHPIRPS